MTPLLAQLQDPTPGPSCLDHSDICQFFYQQTKNAWLAESSYYVLVKPFTILVILVVAFIARWILHRAIDRLVRSTPETSDKPSLFRPLRNRLPSALVLPTERRLQRGLALGSVLRSISSVTIFSIALMLVLDEVGVNLGPLLASAGVAGLAIGFGAQNLVKDFFAGLFMLLEDQYGVGDAVDVGEVSGTVEAVGLRITSIRDAHGVLWYIRNGEIVRVGNKSQGWALVIVDVPVTFASVEPASEVLRAAAATLIDDERFGDDITAPPEVLGVEQITAEGAVLRTTVRTSSEAQWRVGRELRRRLTEALDRAGIAAQLTAGRVYIRPPIDDSAIGTGAAHNSDTGQGGAT